MSALNDTNTMSWWRWVKKRWPSVSPRTCGVILAVYTQAERRWMAFGEGRDLRFERLLGNQYPYDREIITVRFDAIGRLKGCHRTKVIHIEEGRSHADLCRMLGVEEPKR